MASITTRKKLSRNKYNDVVDKYKKGSSLFNPYATGSTGGLSGQDTLHFQLSKTSAVYPASSATAIPTTDFFFVLGFEGVTQIPTYIDPTTIECSAVAGMKADIVGTGHLDDITGEWIEDSTTNGTIETQIRIVVMDGLIERSGTVSFIVYSDPPIIEYEDEDETEIKSITYDGPNQKLEFSWALALAGNNGQSIEGSAGKGRNIIAYTSTSSRDDKPKRPEGGHFNTASWDITWPTDPDHLHEWGDSNELEGFVWMSNCDFDNDGNPITHTKLDMGEYTWTDPICITGANGDNGADGSTTEFIFKRVNLKEDPVPTIPNFDSEGRSWDAYGKKSRDFIPSGWSDHPNGISTEFRVEYAATRTYNVETREWEWFVGPFLWACWGEDGIDGDGVEYIFAVTQSLDTPPTGMPKSTDAQLALHWQDPEIWDYIVAHNLTGTYSPWSDDPSDVSPDEPFEWVSIRRRKWVASESESKFGEFEPPVLWARWSKDGEDGEPGEPGPNGLNTAQIFLYYRTDSEDTITIDWDYPLYYSFEKDILSTSSTVPGYVETVPSGWSRSIPPRDEGGTIWVTAATASSRTDLDKIDYNEWSEPQILTEKGLNSVTVMIFRRSSVPLGSADLPTNTTTYNFKTGDLTGLNKGWSKEFPGGSYPCYVSQATAISPLDEDTIPASEWSDPVLFVENGEKGLQGCAVRGPYDWDSLTSNRPMESGGPGDDFIDIVVVDGDYYVCIDSYTHIGGASFSSEAGHYKAADVAYDFVATNLLLAETAKIRFLSNNELYLMYDNQITGGAKGGDSSSPVIFWAGSSDVLNAPYRVLYDGTVEATKGVFGCMAIDTNDRGADCLSAEYSNYRNEISAHQIRMTYKNDDRFISITPIPDNDIQPGDPNAQIEIGAFSDSSNAIQISGPYTPSSGQTFLTIKPEGIEVAEHVYTSRNQTSYMPLADTQLRISVVSQSVYNSLAKDDDTLYIIV